MSKAEGIQDLLRNIAGEMGLHLTATQYGIIACEMSKENLHAAYENPEKDSVPRHKSATQTRDTKRWRSFP